MLRVVCCVCILAALGAAEDMDLPELRVRKEAKIVNIHGHDEPGIVLEIKDDGTVVFLPSGAKVPVPYQKDQYRDVVLPISAEQIINKRAELLLAPKAGDMSVEILRTIRWGLEQEGDPARAATATLASAAVDRYPADVRIAAVAIDLLKTDPEQVKRIEEITRQALVENPAWRDGYQILAEVLEAQNREGELVSLVEDWLKRQPTNLEANLLMAEHAQATGQLELAREAFYKAFNFHDHADAGWGYARLSLLNGHLQDAGEASRRLIELGQHTSQAEAVLGIAQVNAGEDAAAIPLLERALQAQLDAQVLALARYNLGLAQYRQGMANKAVSTWKQSPDAAGNLAIAIATRRPVALGELPDGPLKAVGRELNACLSLERKDYQRARAQLEGGISERHLFLNHIADVLANNADQESVATLAQHTGDESLHWQVYAHLLAQQLDEAQDLLDRLPEDDGYAAVCRVFVAEARGEHGRARKLFEALSDSKNPPAGYVARLADEFGNENDELRAYDFNWPDGFNLSEGWTGRSAGTGILVKIDGGKLVLEGTQTPSQDPVSSAWCLVSPEKLARVTAQLSLAAVDQATVGVEFLDEARANGLAYGVLPSGQLAWRSKSGGSWGKWKETGQRVDGGKATLTLEYDHRLARILLKHPKGNQAAGGDVHLASPYLSVGVFGESDPGVTWRLAVTRMEMQLKPPQGAQRPQTRTRGRTTR
ncbi:MAG: hypothetical protein PF961_07380 [Planctomycetota bacterium]|jgi:tetratricopeptide (TPR) repeat protein|nr:hypothetical protein [Planctomycetota bacterium]